MLSQSRDHVPIKEVPTGSVTESSAPRSSWLTPPLTPEALRWRPWTPEDLEEIFGPGGCATMCHLPQKGELSKIVAVVVVIIIIKTRGTDKLHKTINIWNYLQPVPIFELLRIAGCLNCSIQVGSNPTCWCSSPIREIMEQSWPNTLYPKWLGNLSTNNFPVESPGFLMFPWQHHLAHQSIP